jgi:hypothetical protein
MRFLKFIVAWGYLDLVACSAANNKKDLSLAIGLSIHLVFNLATRMSTTTTFGKSNCGL